MSDGVVWTNDMGCTPDDLKHWLTYMAKDTVRFGTYGAVVPMAGGAAVLEWQKKPPRVIGMVSMPVTHVNISFKGVADSHRKIFIKQFEDVTRRGGG
ncbi:MAG: hypothetical protein ACRCV9_04490 [Burkholderiaceae bacterium]